MIAEGDAEHGGAGSAVELLSPDSGMTTIRSSRSSKASSVFLSDDSPVGDVTAGGAATGLSSSLSPPVPPERMKRRHNRNKSDNFDLLSLDPLHGDDDSVPAGKKKTSCQSRGGVQRAESSSFSELEELNLMDFSGFSVVGMLERGASLPNHHDGTRRNDAMDAIVPPTPVNSVVGSRPPSSCGVRFFPEDVVERINSLQHKDSMSSSLSETWDELDTQGASTSSDSAPWNRTVDTESPLNTMEEVSGKELSEKRDEEESFHSKRRFQTLEPQLSLIIEPAELYDRWNPDSLVKDQWNPVTLSCLQLTPPEEEEEEKTGKSRTAGTEKASSLLRKKAVFATLTPDTSKEEDEGTQGQKGDRQTELLDFWTYSAQKGFLKSDSGTTTSYPESLDMWNLTIRDDSLSPLTTPDNISETSGSFCRSSPTAGAEATVGSPLGYTDSGMAMWNTTIHEDSSSALTTPEASENRNLVGMAAPEAGASPEARESKVVEGERAREEDRDTHAGSDPTLGKAEPDYRVKIVIETVEDKTLDDDDDDDDTSYIQNLQKLASELPEEFGGADTSMPVPAMVTSASQYDNVGASGWSLSSSPEPFASPVIDIIHLEEQSSPFVAVRKPHQMDEEHRQYQQNGHLGRTAPAAGRQQESLVFRFGRASESGNTSRASSVEGKYDSRSGERSEEEADWNEQSTNHSPFFLVDIPALTQDTSADRPPRDFQIAVSHGENGSVPGEGPSPHRSLSGAEPETLRSSRDSLQPGSQDDLRSSSDGDSSGLEMEYIVVPGTVKEAGREPCTRHQQLHRQSDQTSNPAEMISKQDQVEAARSDQENLGSSGGHQMAEMIIYNQPKSHSIQPQVEDGNHDGSSGSLPSNLSPSLRYPSDHFLKAREEVYVHSQISMEDSDEGGQSPSAPPPCSTSLGDMQTWTGPSTRKETPQSTSEPQSPIFTHSSLSHSSSSASLLSESGVSTDRGLSLPFSGDLMEEKNNEVEHEEDVISAQNILTRWAAEPQGQMKERPQAESPQLFCFAGGLNGASLLPQREGFQQDAADHCDGQHVSFVHAPEKWLTKQPTSDGQAPHVSYSLDSR